MEVITLSNAFENEKKKCVKRMHGMALMYAV